MAFPGRTGFYYYLYPGNHFRDFFMLSHNQLKHVSALKIKKFRDEYGEFAAEGNTLVQDLIQSPLEVASVYALQSWIVENLRMISEKKLNVYETEAQDMARISSLSSPSQVLAVVKIPDGALKVLKAEDIEQLEEMFPGIFQMLSLVLEDISDPGNFGTIVRIADWFGIRTIFCSESSVELYNPKVIQASMGSVARVRVVKTDLQSLLGKIRGRIPVYGTFLDGENIYGKTLETEGFVVIGSEAHGISAGLSSGITNRLFIPSFGSSGNGKAESLNAAVAAAIVISEFRRRKS